MRDWIRNWTNCVEPEISVLVGTKSTSVIGMRSFGILGIIMTRLIRFPDFDDCILDRFSVFIGDFSLDKTPFLLTLITDNGLSQLHIRGIFREEGSKDSILGRPSWFRMI